ncbi:hypothetical protein [Poriferisphaera sp. WC338]|uniref:hypothetical protein n=1 Tax=Poriferisphaera sp. WC338 TaxID=3425129 RepID=UPI003D81C075
MRQTIKLNNLSLCIVLVVMTGLSFGCAGSDKTSSSKKTSIEEIEMTPEEADRMIAYMQRIKQQQRDGQSPGRRPTAYFEDDPNRPKHYAPQHAQNTTPGSQGRATAGANNSEVQFAETQPTTNAQAAPIVSPPTVQMNPPLEELSQKQLLDELQKRALAGSRSELQKAIISASLSLADTEQAFNAQAILSLTPKQKLMVERYHAMLTTLVTQSGDERYRFDRSAIQQQMNQLFGKPPLTIRKAELCKGVYSYGVYEPFESTTFFAGQNNDFAVYVELENYETVPTPEKQFRVDLQQEVVLYDDDGLAVWRLEPANVNDISRNQRRDFYSWQKISLPARLGVGEYFLKIRVQDINSGQRDELTLPITMVANQTAYQDRIRDASLRTNRIAQPKQK